MEAPFPVPIDVGAPSLLPASEMSLPPEIWMAIFRFATQPPYFFDSRWHYGMVTAFHDARTDVHDHWEIFDASLYTKRAISLVCRDWRRFSSEVVYQHIYLRRRSRLALLVRTLEESRANAVGDNSVSLGWWITHLKLSVIYSISDFLHDSTISPTSYASRLLACCPRLEVLIDAAPYGIREPPPNILSAIAPISPSSSHMNIRSIEWIFGGPTLGDLVANPHVAQSIHSLRCNIVHDRRRSVESFKLPLVNLASLDLFLSPESHTHWHLLSITCALPSLTHLTIRTPDSTGPILGVDPIQSLKAFLTIFGPQLVHLDLEINPRNMPLNTPQHAGEDGPHIFSVSPILALCPNITELIISARWIASHNRNPSPNSTETPFSVLRHDNIRRVGLRDTSPRAEGFSTLYSSRPCESCTRLSLFHPGFAPMTSPGRGEHAGQHGSSAWGTDLVMSHRHCTIDRHLRALLYGFLPLDQLAARRVFGDNRRFPSLTSVRLLDPERGMFDLVDDQGKCDQWRTCWCTPRVMRVEPSFWAAWSLRCGERGVDLLDRKGDRIRGYDYTGVSHGPNYGKLDGGAGNGWILPHVDLEEELSMSMIGGISGLYNGGLPSLPPERRLSLFRSLLGRVTGWLLEKGILGVIRSAKDTLYTIFEIIFHVVICSGHTPPRENVLRNLQYDDDTQRPLIMIMILLKLFSGPRANNHRILQIVLEQLRFRSFAIVWKTSLAFDPMTFSNQNPPTIAQTVTERTQEKAPLGARFFFFFPRRGGALASYYPPSLPNSHNRTVHSRNVIVEALRQEPTLVHKRLLSQFHELFLTPLLKSNPFRHPTLIILDALDECVEKRAADILRLVFSHAMRILFLGRL
ncbi:hypothetical protein BS47DRAFT_1484390 [Hydnum rufescens UP504]|uniref:Nephrocystin 3-like N-terminal domain-containing protein n=1 Tax=Hydnum rufescens UP504 TaxID=1448309 RepID=A0A9P6B119_9AGAM|nr:hypothetical protein BS47DRAFT_1484390 [Hydnum rufescens UP504]